MADKIDQLKIGTTSYDIDLPPDATPSVASLTASGAVTGNTIVKSGGTSSQFLKADGSVDSNTYAVSSHAHGNITNTGTITSTAVSSATGVLVYDSNNKIQRATAANARSIIGAGTSSLTLGTTDTTAAYGNHLYHYWTTNQYYNDSYSGEKNWRMMTESVLADTLRWKAGTIANKEYWDYDSSSWKTSSLDFSNLFNGNYNDGVNIPYAQRKFRFTMTASSGWGTTTMLCLEGSWYNAGTVSKVTGTDAYVVVTIETRARASDSWTTKVTANFPSNCMNKQALCVPSSALHTGQSLYRITVELGAWTSTSNSASLRRLMILSNYAGSSLTPFTYDGSGKVTAMNTLNATTLQEDGTSLTSKYQAKLPTTTTANKVLKSTTTPGTVQWGDDANTTYTFAEGTTNKAFTVTPSGGTAQTVSIHGLGDASLKDVTTSVTSGDGDLVTSGGVHTALSNMVTTATSSTLTANKILLGNGAKTLKSSSYQIATSNSTTWDETSNVYVPTMCAISNYVNIKSTTIEIVDLTKA